MESNLSYRVERIHERLVILTRESTVPIQYTWVFIHGMGENSDHYVERIQKGEIEVPEGIRLVMPEATQAMVNRIKQVTYSWYNVEALDPEDPKRYNEEEMQLSMDYI